MSDIDNSGQGRTLGVNLNFLLGVTLNVKYISFVEECLRFERWKFEPLILEYYTGLDELNEGPHNKDIILSPGYN